MIWQNLIWTYVIYNQTQLNDELWKGIILKQYLSKSKGGGTKVGSLGQFLGLKLVQQGEEKGQKL